MSGIDQNYSDCVFEDDEDAIRFVGVEPTKDFILRKDQIGDFFGEDIKFTRFESDPATGDPHMIIYQRILKTDDTGQPTQLGEEKIMMVKSFFQNKKGVGRRWWKGGRNKRGRKSKKYSKTKSKSRTRRGGRRSRRVRHRVKRKSRR